MASSSTLDNLSRLASKPGVQSTLILSRSDGAIIRSTGLSANVSISPSQALDFSGSVVSPDGSQPGLKEPIEEKTAYENERDQEGRDAESVAKMVFAFVSSVAGFVTELDGGNDVQLLRLRTRKYEMVIVPDSKYLLVVIHDPPKSP